MKNVLILARAQFENPFARFLAVGVLNTAFGYGVYYLLLRASGHAIFALTLGTIIGVLFNFLSTGGIVFRSRDPRLVWRFVLVYVVVYLYNAIGLATLESRGVDPAIGGLVLIPGAVAISWLLNSRFVFGRAAPNGTIATSR